MNADLLFSNVEFLAALSGQRLRVTLGRQFKIRLNEAPARPISWFSNNDEVLSIEDDSSLTGTVTCTAVGKSTIEWQQGGRILGTLRIEVYKPPSAVSKVDVEDLGDEPRTP